MSWAKMFVFLFLLQKRPALLGNKWNSIEFRTLNKKSTHQGMKDNKFNIFVYLNISGLP